MARLPASGIVDGDGHVLEPASLWDDYVDQPFRERAIHIRVNPEGLEYIEFDGAPFTRLRPGSLSMLGTMGHPDVQAGADRRYMETMPLGACDPGERLQLLDKQGLDAAVLYPTLGIIWEIATRDTQLADAMCRAYNRWIADFCRHSEQRLVAIAHLTLADPDLAAAELERAVGDGCRGATFLPWNWNRIPHGDPFYDRLWDTAQGLGVPVTIHPGYEPDFANTLGRYLEHDSTPGIGGRGANFMSNMAARIGVQECLTSFFAYATLDRFPRLRLGVLESGAGWLGSQLDRMESLQGETILRRTTDMRLPASEYFRRQCFISCDPDETAAPLIVDHVGSDCFIWATDYPHPDHPDNWREGLERFVRPLSDETAARVAGANVKSIYGIG